MDQGILPRWDVNTEAGKLEARRVFYVGLTRARHEVHIVCSGFTEDKYGRRHERGVSEFVREVHKRAKATQ